MTGDAMLVDCVPSSGAQHSAPSGVADERGAAHLCPVQTTPYLTKFEFARIVGMLTMQLTSTGAAQAGGDIAYRVASRDVLAQRVPFVVRRYLPDGGHEDCALANLRIDASLHRLLTLPDLQETIPVQERAPWRG